MFSDATRARIHQEKLVKYKQMLDPLEDDIRKGLVPHAYLKNKFHISKDDANKYLKLLYDIEVDWKHIERNSKYYGFSTKHKKKSKKSLPVKIDEDFLPIVDKKEFITNFRLPPYIKMNLLKYGNTVIKKSTYLKLGATGVRYTIKRQFGLDTILEIVNNRTCVVYTKGNRPYEGGYASL